jgi:hypothetical protein
MVGGKAFMGVGSYIFGLLLFGCVKDTSVLYGDERTVLH